MNSPGYSWWLDVFNAALTWMDMAWARQLQGHGETTSTTLTLCTSLSSPGVECCNTGHSPPSNGCHQTACWVRAGSRGRKAAMCSGRRAIKVNAAAEIRGQR